MVIASLTADLVRTASKDVNRYSYRKMAAGAFTKQRIGYHSFRKAVLLMEASGLLTLVSGIGGGTGRWVATRFRATARLLKLANDKGVVLSDWRSHFRMLPRPKSASEPLVLRSASVTKHGKKTRGAPIRVDLGRSPARELAEQVQRLNAFFAPVLIEPPESHYGFNRVFNDGNIPGFAWNKGGRLYSMGDSYQQMPRVERARMRLNGEEVVELDLRASHLTILHALLKQPFDVTIDPYEIPGLPRHITKAWITMTLGHDRFQRCWSKENKLKYHEQTVRNLQKDYPIRQVREKVLAHLPALADWPSCSVRWGDLQYTESEAIIGAVATLAFDHAVPALPVHDSIIVPKSAERLALSVLEASFEGMVGVRPTITSFDA
jgi:hypothetical protein